MTCYLSAFFILVTVIAGVINMFVRHSTLSANRGSWTGKMTFEQQMRFMSTILISDVILLMSMLRHMFYIIYRYSSMVVSYTAVW